jgi:hypothetical protein
MCVVQETIRVGMRHQFEVDLVFTTHGPVVHLDGDRRRACTQQLLASAGPNQSSVVEDKVIFVFNFADYLSTIAPRSQ